MVIYGDVFFGDVGYVSWFLNLLYHNLVFEIYVFWEWISSVLVCFDTRNRSRGEMILGVPNCTTTPKTQACEMVTPKNSANMPDKL